jgi:hypothetical protein
MRISKTLMTGAVASVAVAGSAMASVTPVTVYDSTSMYQAGSSYPGVGGGTVGHYTQAYWAAQATEFGGKVGLAGTARQAHSATVQMRTGSNASGAQAGNVTMSLNFYSINNDGSVGSLLGSKTQTFATPASTGPSSNSWQWRPYFDCTFDLSSLGLTLPDQVYYGLAFDANQNSVANSLNFSLWNYGADPGGYVFNGYNYWYGDATPRLVDGPQVKTGTDLMMGLWGRYYDGGAGYTGNLWTSDYYYGMTPNISISAVPAPGAIALLGMAGLVGRRRKA